MALAVVGGLVMAWLALLATLWLTQRRETDPAKLSDGLRILPDAIGLVRRLASDRSLPSGVRIRLGLLVGYLLLPVDLVPDFIPVVGYADDAIIVALTLRAVVRRAGPGALPRHWPGTPEGLLVVQRLAGML
ncbi:MAG: DUF1232 domain-containing protein [Nocardioidaceae bacterium]|nr:DUF1232 domain-containing protein [Nocardioidaceae bacterium]